MCFRMAKIKISIDGKSIMTEEGANLLQVARENGINIPGLCYHKKLTPTGACRLCVCKIDGMPGLTMSCTVEVKDGMKVIAFDKEIENNRKHTLDYLLAEHNEEADGTFQDEMQELVVKYGLDKKENRNFSSLWESMNYPLDDSSPVLTYDASKCIKCFRCIKACEEVQGKSILSFAERGITKYIVAGFGTWSESECDGCGECVQLCPTGALVEKPHREEIKNQEPDKKVITSCPYCGVGCQIELHVQDGKIMRSTGVEGVSPNDGRLCVKGRFGLDFVHHSERLKSPLIKKNGKFEEATWDEALSLIASKFNEIKANFGPKALAGYSSAKVSNEDNYIFQKFIRLAFENNNVDYCTRLCHASTVTAMLKSIGDGAGSNSIEDFETTDCLFVTGNNIIETHPITATYVKRGYQHGQKIIVVDPRWTPLVKYATVWLQPRLGTDVAMLNGLMHIIIREGWINKNFIESRVDGGMQAFEALKELVQKYTPEETERITNVPADKLFEAAKIYANAPTAMIATGMGMSQATVGTNNVFSLLNMCFITGQIGREACGINPPRGQNNVQGATDVGASPVNYPGYIPIGNDENRRRMAKLWNVDYEKLDPKPGLSTVEIMQAIHHGDVKGLYIMGENPVVTDPNQNHTIEALENIDFLVVQDIFHTETTKYADVILPASSFAEKNGTVVNSDRRVLRLRKAVEMPGRAREDWRIIMDIAEHMGVSLGEYNSAKEIFDEIAEAVPIMGGISYDRLENGSIQWPCPTADHPGTPTLFLEKFNTPNGLAKLFPVEHVEQKERASEEFPLIMNSGRMLFQYHSATMSRKNDTLNAYANKSFVLINPEDADRYNISDGDHVHIASARGSLVTIARIVDEVAPGEMFMPWHFSEAPVNALTRDELDPMSKIAPFKYSAVKIQRAE
ncbi:MAG: formate dehydrogenase subunit alpha [Marinilabiliales bacterium]|nr:MAG: formate dehydrogenase subunit alpha [Marinilabiliales bacterium]